MLGARCFIRLADHTGKQQRAAGNVSFSSVPLVASEHSVGKSHAKASLRPCPWQVGKAQGCPTASGDVSCPALSVALGFGAVVLLCEGAGLGPTHDGLGARCPPAGPSSLQALPCSNQQGCAACSHLSHGNSGAAACTPRRGSALMGSTRFS